MVMREISPRLIQTRDRFLSHKPFNLPLASAVPIRVMAHPSSMFSVIFSSRKTTPQIRYDWAFLPELKIHSIKIKNAKKIKKYRKYI